MGFGFGRNSQIELIITHTSENLIGLVFEGGDGVFADEHGLDAFAGKRFFEDVVAVDFLGQGCQPRLVDDELVLGFTGLREFF